MLFKTLLSLGVCFSYPLFLDAAGLLGIKMRVSPTYQGHFYILGNHLLVCTDISNIRDISTNTECYAVTQPKDLRRHLLMIYPPEKLIF